MSDSSGTQLLAPSLFLPPLLPLTVIGAPQSRKNTKAGLSLSLPSRVCLVGHGTCGACRPYGGCSLDPMAPLLDSTTIPNLNLRR